MCSFRHKQIRTATPYSLKKVLSVTMVKRYCTGVSEDFLNFNQDMRCQTAEILFHMPYFICGSKRDLPTTRPLEACVEVLGIVVESVHIGYDKLNKDDYNAFITRTTHTSKKSTDKYNVLQDLINSIVSNRGPACNFKMPNILRKF